MISPEPNRVAVNVRLENVSKSFGSVVALRPTTIDIPRGELVALLGPSGCGKTTTLRIIAGFEIPDTGSILIDERDVSELPPNRRNLGMVFQNYSLFPHMTVGENVAFGLKMAKRPRDEIERRVREILDLVQLPGYQDRHAYQLSGGQQQRVALARALVTNPSVLLLDEPLGALDKNLRENMQFELRRLQQRLGITSILVTHDQEEALTVSDRVMVMNRGCVLQVGTPTEVYERPRTRFTSEFLGTSNLFECDAVGADGPNRLRVSLSLDGSPSVQFWVPKEEHKVPSGRVMIAVRPEKMALSATASDGLVAIPASVMDRVFRGTYHAYQVRIAGLMEPVFVYHQAKDAGGRDIVDVGTEVYATWDPVNGVLLQCDEDE